LQDESQVPISEDIDKIEVPVNKEEFKIDIDDISIAESEDAELNFKGMIVDELKEYCRAWKLKISGKKPELIDRLEEHYKRLKVVEEKKKAEKSKTKGPKPTIPSDIAWKKGQRFAEALLSVLKNQSFCSEGEHIGFSSVF
jgi:hypothetical protein